MKTHLRTMARIRRHQRVRKSIAGTAQRPRLAVYRSLHHIYAQLIDDDAGHTLASASSVETAVAADTAGANKTQVATAVGALLGHRAVAAGIEEIVFDRGGFPFHGRVKALADAARAAGLHF